MQVTIWINLIRDLIADLNLSYGAFLGIGLLFFATLMVATREILCWFLRVHPIRRELKNMYHELQTLRSEIASLREVRPSSALDFEQEDAEQDVALKNDHTDSPAKRKAFRIFH